MTRPRRGPASDSAAPDTDRRGVRGAGLSRAGWQHLAELVDTHGEDTTTGDAETNTDVERQMTLLLEYEAQSDALCEQLG